MAAPASRIPRPAPRRTACGAPAAALAVALAACGPPAPVAPPDPGAAADVPAAAPVAAPEIPADAPVVAILGDSIAAGLHLARHESFPAVLQRRLAAAGRPFHLVNGGVSGDTTAGGLSRIDWILSRKPQVVVVELGANDGMRGQPLDAMERNLRGIVERARAAGARVLLLGIRLPPNYGPEYTGGFEAIYPRVAADGGATFAPYFMEGVAGRPEMNLPDGIHPTPQGHERLAANVESALSKLLDEVARDRAGSR